MKGFRWLLPGLTILLLTVTVASARPPAGRQDPGSGGSIFNVPDLASTIDVNETLMFVTNQGSFAFDQLIGDSGLEWPKGSGKHVVFASGVWLGAKVGGETRVTVAEYSQEFAAGPLDASGNPVDPDQTDAQWRVLKIEPGDTEASNADYALWKQLGQSLGEDGPPLDDNGEPQLIGDQTMWCVYNDAVASLHTNDAGFSAPLGVEVRQTTFAFNRTGALGKTIFLDFTIENKGSNVLEDMYLALWSDPDLGGFSDDLVGADTTLSLGFCYNATNTDATYGANVPAVGYDFFLGPVVGGDTLGMSSFNKYINGTDPSSPIESFNYMQGLTAAGEAQTCLGVETTFVLTGDPVTGTGCLDSDPADRRFMMSTGPITMNPGESQRIVAAIIVGGEAGKGDRLSNVSLLKFYDLAAQDAFDRDFVVPSPPPAPDVQVTEMDGEVILSWGSASQLEYDQAGYAFEGYNVYQGESAAGPYKLIATYDVVNGIAVINDVVFNPDVGALETIVVQQGKDAGVRHEVTLTGDAVRGGPLRNGRPYHFAVTAYAYGPDAIDGQKTLENPVETRMIIPQALVSGVDLGPVAVGTLTYNPVDPAIPPPTNEIAISVVEPSRVTGHGYRLSFHPVDPFTATIDGVDYPVSQIWRVTDSTTGQTVLDNQFNLTGNDDFDVIDGLQINMTGVYEAQVQGAAYKNNNSEHRRALSWVNWGGRFFGGAVDTGCLWSGSQIMAEESEGCGTEVIPDRFATVELRFSGTQKGYRYARQEQADGSPPPAGRGYVYLGFDDVSCTVWKVVGSTETQLTVMYTERELTDAAGTPLPDDQQLASHNALWLPTSEGAGGREYLTILDLPYSEDAGTYGPGGSGGFDLQQNGIYFAGDDPTVGYPAMYGAWFRIRGDSDVIDPEDEFVITWGNPGDDNDRWDFTTTAGTGIEGGVVVGDLELAKTRADLARIRAVPNPYMTRSAYELDQFNRIMKFVNLPATCTVRIFTLAGDLVRTLEKDDASTSVIEWDLESRFGLPVGSGIFVYHVEAPGIGNQFGKIGIIMEEERLEDF